MLFGVCVGVRARAWRQCTCSNMQAQQTIRRIYAAVLGNIAEIDFGQA